MQYARVHTDVACTYKCPAEGRNSEIKINNSTDDPDRLRVHTRRYRPCCFVVAPQMPCTYVPAVRRSPSSPLAKTTMVRLPSTHHSQTTTATTDSHITATPFPSIPPLQSPLTPTHAAAARQPLLWSPYRDQGSPADRRGNERRRSQCDHGARSATVT